MDGARAIADPVRRDILELLHASPLSAGEIAGHFAISRPAISKHLAVLIDCGAVEVATSGRQRLYSLRSAPLLEVVEYLSALLAPVSIQNLDALTTEVARTRRERRATENETSRPRDSETERKKRA